MVGPAISGGVYIGRGGRFWYHLMRLITRFGTTHLVVSTHLKNISQPIYKETCPCQHRSTTLLQRIVPENDDDA